MNPLSPSAPATAEQRGNERVLVSISSHPMGERVVRSGADLARQLGARFYVVFVDTPGHRTMPDESRLRVQRNLTLAERLGAQVYRISSESVADELRRFCRQHAITRLVVGRPSRAGWRALFSPSVLDELLRAPLPTSLEIVGDENAPTRRVSLRGWLPHQPLARYLFSLALVAAATVAGYLLQRTIDPANLVMIYLAAVVLAAVFLGRGPSILASLLSVLLFDFFLVRPHFSLAVHDTQYIIIFAGLLVVGLVISNSASMLREQVEALRKQENQAQAINRFSQELTGVYGVESVLDSVTRSVAAVFGPPVVVLLVERQRLRVRAVSPGFTPGAEELAMAEWALKHEQPAGAGSDYQPNAGLRFVPLITARGVIGVLCVAAGEGRNFIDPDLRILLAGFANLSALAIERARFGQDALQAETLRAAERLQSALLNSISHQLRTPLATITGVLTSLEMSDRAPQPANKLDEPTRLRLIQTATTQANHLNRLVENLLNMTRLEAGVINVKGEPGDVQDLVGAVMNQMAGALARRKVDISLPADLPNVVLDPVLSAQVLVNLIENADKFSPPETPILIEAQAAGAQVEISVTDRGPGVPEEDLGRIFDKFYRAGQDGTVSGTGLGLSICKGLVEAQGGTIWARNEPAGGLRVSFTLPAQPDGGGQP